MFYNYIIKKLKKGEVKIGLAAINTEDKEMYIEGKGFIKVAKFFLSTKEKKRLRKRVEDMF